MLRNTPIFQTSTLALTSILVATTLSAPLNQQPLKTSDSWIVPSRGPGKSHLVMWMVTEKQLIPRLTELVDSAAQLLELTCEQEGKAWAEECLDFASSLPSLTGLDAVLPQKVIKNEKRKNFVQLLVENAYRSLEELQALMEEYVLDDDFEDCSALPAKICHIAEHFTRSLNTVTSEYRQMMTSFYKSKLTKSKPPRVNKDEFPVERQFVIKALYVAVDRLKQMSSVLEYSVQLSWFSRLDHLTKGGKGGSKRKTKRNKKL